MGPNEQTIHILAASALRTAGEVARARLGRDVAVGEAQVPDTTALLRFDLDFGNGKQLSWFVTNEDATGFSDMLIGGPGDRGATLTEMHLDALSGAFSDMLERAVDGLNGGLTAPVAAGGVDMGMENALPGVNDGEVQITLALNVTDFGPLVIVQHFNTALTAELVRLAQPAIAAAGEPAAAAPAAPSAAEAEALADQIMAGLDLDDDAPAAAPAPPQAAAAPPPPPHAVPAPDNVVQLPNLGHAEPTQPSEADLRMLLNVPLNVTVELGRTERTVQNLLELNVGSIMELQKLAGDPMDILVNGKVLARGEVVVIDEEFGIRITEILSPEQRLRNIA